ncbi:uncharacterized protein, partial [Narcine bancroftii]|uniref:uncharacterized protein n=1 Tax=Narcine bancroftii TaxID=1343680 RepID=UPI00383135A9
MPDASKDSCSRALLHGWVTWFGVPNHLTSDRGTQFTFALWAQLANRLGIELHCTMTYHPQANGLVDHLHRHLTSAVMAQFTGPDWVDELPWVPLGIRSMPKEDQQASSAELVYGAPLALPVEFINVPHNPQRLLHELLPHLHARLDSFALPLPSRQGTWPSHVPSELLSAEYVFIWWGPPAAPLQRPYEGLYNVVQRSGSTFTLDIGGRRVLFTVDRLKPVDLDPTEPVIVAQHKKRGRPTK